MAALLATGSAGVLALVLVGGALAGGVGQRTASRPAPAAADQAVMIQAVFSSAGNPELAGSFQLSSATVSWSACLPGAACQAIASKLGFLSPGPEPAGTRFIASARFHGTSYSASRTWNGQVHATSQPRLTGRLAAGEPLHLVAGAWTGGWGAEFDQLGAEACRTAAGTGCEMLAGGELGCVDASSHRRLGGWFTGAYVFVFDNRMAAGSACAGTGYDTNADLPLWHTSPTTLRSGLQGRIAGPARPRVHLLSKAITIGDRVRLARVSCTARCAARLEVESGTRGGMSFVRFTGTRYLSVPRSDVTPGRLMVVLHVDDGPGLRGRALFSR